MDLIKEEEHLSVGVAESLPCSGSGEFLWEKHERRRENPIQLYGLGQGCPKCGPGANFGPQEGYVHIAAWSELDGDGNCANNASRY